MSAPSNGAADALQRVSSILGRGDGWEQTYLESATPWDAGQSQPALLALLESKEIEVPSSGTAVVPGCGRGYDVYALAAHGLNATGYDIAPTALEGARKWAAEQTKPKGTFSFEQKDLFADEQLPTFDVAFDYTFFCAFDPSQRPSIGQLYSRLVKPGGLLLALQFPLGEGPPGASKPPFPVSQQAYDDAFGPHFEQIQIGKIDAAMPARKARENMSVWRRKSS